MASPLFHVPSTKAMPYHGLPKTASTGLFLHRMKQMFKAPKPGRAMTAHGHPIIKSPVVVKAPKTVHTSPGGLLNVKGSMY